MSHPLVVGLGSFCGDDQAGWLIIARLQELGYPTDRLLRVEHASRLLDCCGVEPRIIVCDACIGPGQAGTILHFDGNDGTWIYEQPFGSHDLGVPEILQLLNRLSDPVPEIQVWAIEGTGWELDTPPSLQVQSAVENVARAICATAGFGD